MDLIENIFSSFEDDIYTDFPTCQPDSSRPPTAMSQPTSSANFLSLDDSPTMDRSQAGLLMNYPIDYDGIGPMTPQQSEQHIDNISRFVNNPNRSGPAPLPARQHGRENHNLQQSDFSLPDRPVTAASSLLFEGPFIPGFVPQEPSSRKFQSRASNADDGASHLSVTTTGNRKCEECGREFTKPKELTRHRTDVHPVKYPPKKVYVCPCKGCRLEYQCFARPHKCKDHALHHLDDKNYRMEILEITFLKENLTLDWTRKTLKSKLVVKLDQLLTFVAANPDSGVSIKRVPLHSSDRKGAGSIAGDELSVSPVLERGCAPPSPTSPDVKSDPQAQQTWTGGHRRQESRPVPFHPDLLDAHWPHRAQLDVGENQTPTRPPSLVSDVSHSSSRTGGSGPTRHLAHRQRNLGPYSRPPHRADNLLTPSREPHNTYDMFSGGAFLGNANATPSTPTSVPGPFGEALQAERFLDPSLSPSLAPRSQDLPYFILVDAKRVPLSPQPSGVPGVLTHYDSKRLYHVMEAGPQNPEAPSPFMHDRHASASGQPRLFGEVGPSSSAPLDAALALDRHRTVSSVPSIRTPLAHQYQPAKGLPKPSLNDLSNPNLDVDEMMRWMETGPQ